MKCTILTLFPEFFATPLASSLLGRAREQGLLEAECVQLREYGEGKYRAVDARPFGGGPGMVLMPEVLERAMAPIPEDAHVIYLSPQGKTLTAAKARELAAKKHVVFLCGHYEGIDERVIEEFVDEELSIGDYILTGGEPAALVVMDAVSRFIPGVVGEASSVTSDTFETESPEMIPGGLKAPMYTRPQTWRGKEVPAVLLSGNHAEIAKWRRSQSKARTKARRPDLLGR